MREGNKGNRASNEQGVVEEASKTAKQKRDIAGPEHLGNGTNALGISTERDKSKEIPNEDVSRHFGQLRTLPTSERHLGAKRTDAWSFSISSGGATPNSQRLLAISSHFPKEFELIVIGRSVTCPFMIQIALIRKKMIKNDSESCHVHVEL